MPGRFGLCREVAVSRTAAVLHVGGVPGFGPISRSNVAVWKNGRACFRIVAWRTTNLALLSIAGGRGSSLEGRTAGVGLLTKFTCFLGCDLKSEVYPFGPAHAPGAFCPLLWVFQDPLHMAYHDQEWGTPLRDAQGLFELLLLEGVPGRPFLDHQCCANVSTIVR